MTHSQQQTAELFPAFEWICDNCGVNNFDSAVVLEMDGETAANLKEEAGVSDDCFFMKMPDTVWCQHCDAEYETLDWQESKS